MILAFASVLGNQESKAIADFLHSQDIDFKAAVNQGRSVFITKKPLDPFQKSSLNGLLSDVQFIDLGTPYQLASAKWKSDKTIIDVRGAKIGGDEVSMIAGPCAVESEEQMNSIGEYLQSRGIRFMRGGAYKPRTSPYAFQGMKLEGLKLLKEVADKHKLRVVTELMDLSYLEEVYDYADVIQIGTRNMFNYTLLRELGKIDKPIMLKRGFSARIDEWLQAAEYVLLGGNEKVILCERGVRSFETETRNTLDLASLSLVKELSHLPIISDPSQGTGVRSLVSPMSMASIAAGADGLMIEVHEHPEEALSDGQQSLNFREFDELLKTCRSLFDVKSRSFDFEKNSVNFTTSK